MEIDKEYSTINYYDRKVELYNLPWEEKIILLWGWTWRAMIISFIIGIISVPILIVCIILFTVLAGSSGNPSSINNSELYAAISFVVVSAITIIIIFIHTFYVTTQRISDMEKRLSFPRIFSGNPGLCCNPFLDSLPAAGRPIKTFGNDSTFKSC